MEKIVEQGVVEESDGLTEVTYINEVPKSKDDFPTRGLMLLGLAICCALIFQNYWQNRNDILLTQEEITRFQTQVETMLVSMGDSLNQRYSPGFIEINQSMKNIDSALRERNKQEAERYAQIEQKAKEFFSGFNIVHIDRQNEERELELLKSGYYTTHIHTLEQTLNDLHLQNSKIKDQLYKELSEHLPEFVSLDEFEEKKAKYQHFKEVQTPVSREEVDKKVSDYVKELLHNPKFVAKITDYYIDEIYRNVHSPLRGDVKQFLSNKEDLRRKVQQIIEDEIEKRLFNFR